MALRIMPDRKYLREALDYDPATGVFRWCVRPLRHFSSLRSYNTSNAIFAGKTAGTIAADGYVVIHIDGRFFRAHRLAWVMTHGSPVPGEIDHIDGNPSNNSIANLRAANRVSNMANMRSPVNNTSGAKGVRLHDCGRFQARITHDGKPLHLGLFATFDEAVAARRAAEKRLQGRFARHG